MIKKEDIVYSNIDGLSGTDLKSSLSRGDWVGVEDILRKSRDDIVSEVKDSGLRGRGGAGFPTGMKWSFIPKDSLENYLIVNADESEPGTCKDRVILRNEPHKFLEGCVISAKAIGAQKVFIYIRGEYFREAKILETALLEAESAGYVGQNIKKSGVNVEVVIHCGAGAYICGEETALIESLSGRRGMPRLKPPFPANIGYLGRPTVVNNVETIAAIPGILKRGSKWFSSIGPEGSTGTKLFCISGCVNKPCVFEEEMGLSIKQLIEEKADGVQGGWANLVAVIPGGSSTPLLPRYICETTGMDFNSLKAAGSSLGTASMIVINKSFNIVNAIRRFSKFYMHESCGQCTPCREGTGWLWRILTKISSGKYSIEDVDLLENITKNIEGHTICPLGDAAAWPIQGLLRHFGDDIRARASRRSSKSFEGNDFCH